MSYTNTIILCGLLLACCSFFTVIPAHAFTANSLDITIGENGDAIATFRFTLDGFIENAIPQSMLEEELTKGLTTSSDPPVLKSMDRSSAVLLMKKFADTSDVPTGKEYRTATMDFKKAEIALQNSAIGDAVTADFSPATISLTFPDEYKRQFSNVDVLPAVFHTVEDPVKVAQVQADALAQAQASPGTKTTPVILTSSAAKGSINVTSSPQNVKVSIDSQYIGEAPALFQDITAGTHVMEFTKEGYSPVNKTVLVNAGKTTNIMVVLTYITGAAIPGATTTEDTSSSSWFPLFVVITGLVVVGIGGYYYWSEKTPKDKVDKGTRNGITDTRKPVTEKIINNQPKIKTDDGRTGDTGVADTRPVMEKTVIDQPKIKTDDGRTGDTGVADTRPVMEKTVIDQPKVKADHIQHGSAGVADTGKTVTKKTVRNQQKIKADDIRKRIAGNADTGKPDTGDNTEKQQESEDDDTGDECR
jgi:hypothetical protein